MIINILIRTLTIGAVITNYLFLCYKSNMRLQSIFLVIQMIMIIIIIITKMALIINNDDYNDNINNENNIKIQYQHYCMW